MVTGHRPSSVESASTFYASRITIRRIENVIYVKSRMGQEATTAPCGKRASVLSKGDEMGILRLTISCFTGLGVLVLLVTLLAVAWLVVTLRRIASEELQQIGEATFTKQEVERMAAVRYRYQQTLTDDDIDYFQTTWP